MKYKIAKKYLCVKNNQGTLEWLRDRKTILNNIIIVYLIV